jgi:hypothetical protein
MSITLTYTFANEAELQQHLTSRGAAAPAEKTAPAPAPEKKAAAPAVEKKAAPKSERSREEMVAALNEVKEAKGADAAKGIIRDTGGVAKMAEIPDNKIDAVYEAAKKAMEADEGI